MRQFLLGYRTVGLATAVALAAPHCGGTTDPSAPRAPGYEIGVAPAAEALSAPVDATPDPTGTKIYFLASGEEGPGVFEVDALGGPVTEVFAGSPFVHPRGISISDDGETLIVADPDAGSGALFALPASGGVPEPLEGSEGTRPTALDVIRTDDVESIFFTGRRAGKPAVLRLPLAGGTPAVVHEGAPLRDPDGIAVATDTSVYVADREGGAGLPGRVLRLQGGEAVPFGPAFKPGTPAGLSVTLDDQRLLVSALSSEGRSEVVVVDTATQESAIFDEVIGANSASGGVHRARYRETFAWAGFQSVYAIRVKKVVSDSSSVGGPGDV